MLSRGREVWVRVGMKPVDDMRPTGDVRMGTYGRRGG